MIVTSGSPEAAPYRRLWVLKNIKGLAYESPDPKSINTTLSEVVSDDAITLGQLGSILNQLQKRGLATFVPGDASYDPFERTLLIKNLDQGLLKDLISETQAHIDGDDREVKSDVVPTAPAKETPKLKRKFNERHPILTHIYEGVAVGIILFLLGVFFSSTFRSFVASAWRHIF